MVIMMRGQPVKINLTQLQDKINACWMGKNIGGTIGTPYENNRNLLNVTGFTSPPGEPLPNDDLDLQLVWLMAMEDIGPASMNANHLAWYWLKYIYPDWGEYGIGKNNMKIGLLPPLSGEFRNQRWKNSNGAWIRSEVWATLAPGFPDIAVKYAVMDASIDHGTAEGTVAEIFTAALESMAFVQSDIRALIDGALSWIPETSYVAKAVRLVIDAYDRGMAWDEARQLVVKEINSHFADCGNQGWFQAPGNIAFVIIGLLWGMGDFKKSVLYAVNCGDDTDCTAGTVGAILGIIGGMDGLPRDWCEYIGDKILTHSIDRSFSDWDCNRYFPNTCGELTHRIMKLMPVVLHAHKLYVEDTDNAQDGVVCLAGVQNTFSYKNAAKHFLLRSPYSFYAGNNYVRCTVWYDREPTIKPGDTQDVHIEFENVYYDPQWLNVTVYPPEGWTADYTRAVCITHNWNYDHTARWDLRLTAGDRVEFLNRIPVMAEVVGYPQPIAIELVLVG